MFKFWTDFQEYLKTNHVPFSTQSPQPQSWAGISGETIQLKGVDARVQGGFGRWKRLGIAGQKHGAVIESGIYIGNDKPVFDYLFANKDTIEAVMGPLVWDRKEGKKAAWVGAITPYIDDQQAFAWYADIGQKWKEALSKL